MSKKASVFWDTIREARKLVERGTRGAKRARHEQKKMPLKMLQGVRRKMKKRIRKQRRDDIQGGVIFNSFEGKARRHFAICKIKDAQKREKLLRNDFGKTSKVLQTERKIMERRAQRKERRKTQRTQEKLRRRGKAQTAPAEEPRKREAPKKKVAAKRHLNFKDGVLHVNPKLFS